MAATRRPDPPPFRSNEFAPVILATVGWAIAFVVLLTQHHQMVARGQGWWLWVALSGFALGLWGLFMLKVRHRNLRRTETHQPARPEAVRDGHSAKPESTTD